MDNELYVIGNKQFLADMLNGILNMETEKSVHPPHYLQEGAIFCSALEANKIWEKVFSFKWIAMSIIYTNMFTLLNSSFGRI